MLSLLAAKMRRMRTLATQARCFHHTALLAQKRSKDEDGGKNLCPESQSGGCRVLKQRLCDPPEKVSSSGESDCQPECGNKRLSESPCERSVKTSEFKKRRTPFQSMWESYEGKKLARPEVLWQYPEECCPPCEAVRFDVLYYKPSDKCRDYQRTWWECCPRLVPKRVCCWWDAVAPQVQRRCPPIGVPQSACTQDHEEGRMECLKKKGKGCPRLRMPRCRTARFPPSCKYLPPPADCEKVKCPFPSYSECLQADPAVIPERPPECECLLRPSICEQLRVANHMAKHNISLYPCDR